ncbi:hypothetical protein SAMN02745208_02333 [Heyndrickxia coagulans DSM 1 = ATCC 7050]|uniref:Uncharacterized protein n=1 Tax=Heyndrickxia coagulans DSM 1 = ATCC 7050 TaxID=1121088 RepID=A0A8B4BWB9_HEYCO|nr:hypothetical protein SAMN02745208_02333 [Heyndrickxia coagulans DSM 1 = ATCC 7050]
MFEVNGLVILTVLSEFSSTTRTKDLIIEGFNKFYISLDRKGTF